MLISIKIFGLFVNSWGKPAKRKSDYKQADARLTFDDAESVITNELFRNGLSREQVTLLLSKPALTGLIQLQMDEREYVSWLNPNYTDAQNIVLLRTLEDIAVLGGFNMDNTFRSPQKSVF